MKEMTVQATLENIEAVTDFVNAELDRLDCPAHARAQIDIAIDELFGNIARYAYDPQEGPATVRIETQENPQRVILTFTDHGVKYNPLLKEDPELPKKARERSIGGLGIFMVKNMMDDMAYEYKDGMNILSICRIIDQSEKKAH